MARRIFQFDPPDRFLAGTVGQPGQRVFYLQAREGDRLVSVVIEKVQVAALADRLGVLLEDLRGRGIEIPTNAPQPPGDGLEEPVDEAFRTGTLSIAWDTRSEEVIVEARAMTDADDEEEIEVEDDDPDGPDVLRVRLTPTAVLRFIAQARGVVAAGRPPCPWCGQPLEATGHYCPRRNGNRAN